jgi:hypothetical protein
MAFGGQVHDRVGRVRRQHPVHRRAVADIGVLEGVGGLSATLATLSRQAA